MDNYLKYSQQLTSYSEFTNVIRSKLDVLRRVREKIELINDYHLFNFKKFKEIGYVYKCFYELHTDSIYDDAITYSLGFHGYVDCLMGLQNNIIERKMNYATFTKNPSKRAILKKSYYACLKDNNPVKNTINLKRNMIITGPNASGKTTILKSTMINIIMSQQFGCGFYESARLKPFDFLHCYLNIPDTSGRDSLFQAEARRCKEILDVIGKNDKSKTHFCAFDELYSGTNPEEAELSATAFMKYITKNKNISCILTTHFVKVCKNLEKQSCNSINYKMLTEKRGNSLIYKYLLEQGISEVKGGISVLEQMNYPKEIIRDTLGG
jgi:DNA mismatch repair ATPase MutS